MKDVSEFRASIINHAIGKILAANETPFVYVLYEAIESSNPDVLIPYVKNNLIVFNVAPRAVKDFTVESGMVSFSASFGGAHTYVQFAVTAIAAIRTAVSDIMFDVNFPVIVGASAEEQTRTNRKVEPVKTPARKSFPVINNPNFDPSTVIPTPKPNLVVIDGGIK